MKQGRSEDHSVWLQLLPCLEEVQACICWDKHGKWELTWLRDLAPWRCLFLKPCGPCFGCCLLQVPIHHPHLCPCSPLPKASWGFPSPHCLQDWALQAKPPVRFCLSPQLPCESRDQKAAWSLCVPPTQPLSLEKEKIFRQLTYQSSWAFSQPVAHLSLSFLFPRHSNHLA